MAQINSDINLHDLTMLVLNKSEFANIDSEPLANEVVKKYIEIRRIVLKKLQEHTNYGEWI
jgi:hypothetical protein